MADANPASQQAQFSQLRETPAVIEPEDRENRKGNWTLRETVALIAAKKRDEDWRLNGGENEKSKPAELRWKWVENYCWKNGCQRIQNQCNDMGQSIYCAITKNSATTSFVVQQQLLIGATASSPWSPRIGRWRSTSAIRRACRPTS
jgi:hypothetical protein